MDIHELLQIVVERTASDLILAVGAPPILRVGGELIPVEGEKLTEADTKNLVYSLMNAEQIEKF